LGKLDPKSEEWEKVTAFGLPEQGLGLAAQGLGLSRLDARDGWRGVGLRMWLDISMLVNMQQVGYCSKILVDNTLRF
jgi:hypothetical protein